MPAHFAQSKADRAGETIRGEEKKAGQSKALPYPAGREEGSINIQSYLYNSYFSIIVIRVLL
jgi:hypothetical protein